MRVENLQLKGGNPSDKFVELTGTVELKFYKYRGTKADTVGEVSSVTTGGSPGAETSKKQGASVPGEPG